SSRDAAPRPLFDTVARAAFAYNLLFGDTVVEAVLPMPVMPQAIPLRRGLRVEIVVHVIEDIVAPPFYRVLQGRAVKERWVGEFQFPVQREHLSLLHQASGGSHSFRRQQIQRPNLIVVPEYAPRGMRRIIRFDRQFSESR